MLKFNGKDIPNFIKVSKIDIQVLPSVSVDTYSHSSKVGVVAGRTKLQSKTIKATFTAVIPQGESLASCGRVLAQWLKGNDFRESELIISDDTTIRYMAKVINSVELNDCLYAGTGEIEFIVPSGIAEEVKEEYTGAVQELEIDYKGTAPTYPILTLAPTQLINTELEIRNKLTGESVYITGNFKKGDTIEIDNKKNLVKVNGNTAIEVIGFKSNFIELVEGKQSITCNNPNVNVYIKYHTSWL